MATTTKEPWRCVWCKRLNKQQAAFCGSCYTAWDKCVDIHYAHGQKGTSSQPSAPARSKSRKQWQQQGDWEDWGYSPRRRGSASQYRSTESPRKRPKTPKKKQAKESYGAPMLDPPWQPAASTALPPTPEPAVPTAEVILLQQLVQALETTDNTVSDEVQTVIDKTKKVPMMEPSVSAKSVRQAFDKLEKKRKSLQQAQQARGKLHQSWFNYTEESAKRWRSFAEDFAKKDQELEKRVIEAKELVHEARQKYDAAKEANDKQDAALLDAVEEISDGMDEDNPDKMASSEEIQAGIQSMLTTLEGFRPRPVEEAAEAHQAKKPRLDTVAEDNMDVRGPGSAALQPFHKPGK